MREVTSKDLDSWDPTLYTGCIIRKNGYETWPTWRKVVSIGFDADGSIVTLSSYNTRYRNRCLSALRGKQLADLFRRGLLEVRQPIDGVLNTPSNEVLLSNGKTRLVVYAGQSSYTKT